MRVIVSFNDEASAAEQAAARTRLRLDGFKADESKPELESLGMTVGVIPSAAVLESLRRDIHSGQLPGLASIDVDGKRRL